MLHSRNIEEVTGYVAAAATGGKRPDLERCRQVKGQVVSIVTAVLAELEG